MSSALPASAAFVTGAVVNKGDHMNDVYTALDDYAGSLGEAAGSCLRRRLASDPAFCAELAVAVSEVAKVVAAAAVLDDDASFDDCCRPLVERAGDDAPRKPCASTISSPPMS